MKALFGLWQDMKVADLNRVLKPFGVRLVVKKSKDWGKQVTVTAHPIGVAAKRSRGVRVAPKDPVGKVPETNPSGFEQQTGGPG